MTTPEIKSHIYRWETERLAMEAQVKALEAISGKNPDAPVLLCLFGLFTAYTEALAELLDAGDWLSWYWIENDSGAKGHAAGYDDDLRKIRTLDDLCWLVEMARAQ